MKIKYQNLASNIYICLALFLMTIAFQGARAQAFVHPGVLEGPADLARMNTKIALGLQPWLGSWNKLIALSSAQTNYVANPQAILVRGTGNGACSTETYPPCMYDAAAAYQLALEWKITGNTAYANTAVNILNAWSSTLASICGDPNTALLGEYGFEFAASADILRTYSGWAPSDFARFQTMEQNIFYPLSHGFLLYHDGTCPSYMWANWDLIQMEGEAAIGVVCDNRVDYNDALTYFTNGAGNGRIDYNATTSSGTVVAEFSSNTLGEGQESGRDQGHAGLEVSLEGAFCTICANQGDNLFNYNSNKVLSLCEYFADYNLGNTVSYTAYASCLQSDPGISPASRGDQRPAWDLIYNEYVNRLQVAAPFSTQYAALLRPEGGGLDYGTTSGAFDQMGFTTLTSTINPPPIANGNYVLVNHASGNALDNNGSTTNGTSVIQWTVDNWYNQYWTVTYLGNGYYKLTDAHGNECLDGMGSTTNGAAAAQQYSSSTSLSQQWMIVPYGSYYQLVNCATGQCLDTGGLTASGSVLQQWNSNSSINQEWSFVGAPSGAGNIPAITSASKVFYNSPVGTAFSYTITATNSPTSYSATGLPSWASLNTSTGVISGTPTATGTSTDAGTYSISLTATNSTGIGTAAITLYVYYVPFASGAEYGIQNRADGNYVDTGGFSGNGASVTQYASNTSINQKWTLTINRDGYYNIFSNADGQCIDTGGLTANGSNMQQWGLGGGSANDQWQVVPLGGGYFKLQNRADGNCLDTDGLTANGSILQQWPSGGSYNQQWQVWAGH